MSIDLCPNETWWNFPHCHPTFLFIPMLRSIMWIWLLPMSRNWNIPLTSFVCGILTLLLRFQTHLPGMQTWAIYFIQAMHLYFSGLTVSQTGTVSLRFHSKHNCPCQQTLWFEHKVITGERHLEAVFWVTVTGHSLRSLWPWREWKLPQPNLSSSSKNVANNGLADKFTTHQVPHRNDHSTHILLPTWGYASGSPQEGQVPILLSCYH